MDYETRNLLHNICWFARGVAGVSIPDGVRFGKGTGLSETRAVAILGELNENGFIDCDAERRVTLTTKGTLWYLSNRHLLPRIPVRVRTESKRWVRTKTHYHRLIAPHARARRYYHRTIRVRLRLPYCPSAWYQWGRWTCDAPAIAGWLHLVTRYWLRQHTHDPHQLRSLVSYIVDEYREYLAPIVNPAETGESGS